jgi:hypothetical protein
MAIFNASNLTTGVVANGVTQVLVNLRNALDAAADLYQWSSGIAAADLESLGFSADDASDILGAIADANAVNQIYTTGQPPSSYPQASSAYIYEESQARIWGIKLEMPLR